MTEVYYIDGDWKFICDECGHHQRIDIQTECEKCGRWYELHFEQK